MNIEIKNMSKLDDARKLVSECHAKWEVENIMKTWDAYESAIAESEAKYTVRVAEDKAIIADLEKRCIVWHPVEEGLPKDGFLKLITVSNVVARGWNDKGIWRDHNDRPYIGGIVTAWATMPAPYKRKEK